jgi:hypothetical protein
LWRLQAVLHFLRGRPKLLTSTGHATNYVRRTNPTKPPYKVQTVQYLLLYYCITFLFLDVLGTLRHLIEICLFEIDSFFLSFYLPVRFAEKCYEYFYSIERVRRESESLAGKSASRMTDRSIDRRYWLSRPCSVLLFTLVPEDRDRYAYRPRKDFLLSGPSREFFRF